ncbi:MAG TPA: asparagine synthase (glutamine-hydrolyzing) [Solirubrobacteraceae bacterium]|jgi:asparagine synthase (glutamine-hydrolysing)
MRLCADRARALPGAREARLMCGVCGITHADPAKPVDPRLIRTMTDAIVHRGPDDDGYFVDGPVGLGMRRLSIIDLAGGKQPIANEDDTIHIVYNGEIYNYVRLRGELERAGHAFSSQSDTEVVVHAYEDHRVGCLDLLRGMFALALWDARERVLLLAVDRFGIKPLYWAVTDAGVTFGSELKCVLRSGMVARELDHDALAQYLTFSYIPPPATIIAGVHKLAPGTYLRWSADRGAEVGRYWQPPPDAANGTHTPGETRARLRDALAETVRSHLVSDVPVGAFLSGGIDSSAIVALMSEASDEPVRTFSIGFTDPRHSELDKARIVARKYNTQHHELIVEPEAVDLLPKLIGHFDEPFGDASALPTYHVSKLAHEHVKVVLSGDGGDELFLGYTLFRGLTLARHAQALPAPLRHAAAALTEHAPRTPSAPLNDRLALLRRRVANTLLAPEEAYKRKISAPGIDALAPVLAPELRSSIEQRNPFQIVDDWLETFRERNGAHPLSSFVHTGFQTSLAGDMLVKVDRMSMANSLEVRVPFLDQQLAEHVATIPIGRRMPRWRLKGLLRDAVADELPAEIRNAPKHGFTVPLSAWFRGDLDGFAREVLVSPEVECRGFLDRSGIEKMLSRHREGADDLGTAVWVLLVFELWCRETLD